MSRVFFVLGGLLFVGLLPLTVLAQRSVRVFVAPVETVDGFKSSDHQRKEDSRQDILNGLQREKTIQIVQTRAEADLTLTVISSDYQETGKSRTTTVLNPTVRGTASTTTADTAPTVVVKVTAGTFEQDFRGQYPSSIRWRDAANNARSKVTKWIKDNRETLTKAP